MCPSEFTPHNYICTYVYIPGEHALLTSVAEMKGKGKLRLNSSKVWRAKISASASGGPLLNTFRSNFFSDKAASHSALAST